MITGNDVSAKLKKQQEWEGLCLADGFYTDFVRHLYSVSGD